MSEQKLLDDHLDWLEAESIYIIREVVAQCAKSSHAIFRRQRLYRDVSLSSQSISVW